MSDSPLDRNLERLLRGAARPAPPDAAFRERLLEELLEAARARSSAASRPTHPGRARRIAAASLAVAAAAGLLLWLALRSPERATPAGATEGRGEVAAKPAPAASPEAPPTRARVYGRLTDRDGMPVPSVGVVGITLAPRWNFHSTIADEDGRYELTPIPDGPLAFYVHRMDRQFSVWIETAEVPRGTVDRRVDLVLPAGTLTGSVLEAATGRPVSGARVALLARQESLGEGVHPVAFAWAGEDGRFRVENLGTASYRVTAVARDLGQETGEEIFVPDGGWKETEALRLGPGGSATLVFLDAEGNALSGGMVEFVDERGDVAMLAHAGAFLEEDGRIEIPGAKPGLYTARVWRDGRVALEGTFRIARGERTEATLRPKGPE